MAFRFLVTLFLLLAASAAYGNALQVTYEGQVPENVVIEGAPITYTFHNLNVDDDSSEESDGIGTGMQISVDGTPIGADSDDFSSEGCEVDDPPYEDFWACGYLDREGQGEEVSFTWTPPGAGTYVMDFYGLCQELPIPSSGPRYCDVNEGVPTVAYFETIVGVDTDGDGIADANDPDDDNDGIPDDLDEQPLVPSNLCTGGDFDNATLGVAVVDDLTCAARASIDVLGTTQVYGDGGHLRLIAPTIGIQGGFGVLEGGLEDGRLTVISANPCPDCGGYEIGDEGPAGGIVFYVTDGGWHGLEAAREDQSTSLPWGCYGTLIGADGTAIGTGAQNTAAILEACGDRPIAASIAFDYSLNGYDDWFLPAKEELNLMYLTIGPGNFTHPNVGGFGIQYYWSSSEGSDNPEWIAFAAWAQFFGPGGNQRSESKSEPSYDVRAIRAF